MPVNSFDSYPLTWKPDKASLQTPYCRSLAEDLEKNIRSGRLQAGTKLPPQREIADYLDLNYTTITRVYETCKKKGLVYGVVGRGTFVAPHATEETALISGDPREPYIELGAVNGFSEYSALVEEATSAVIEKGYLRDLYAYSYPAGHPHQLAAGMRWMEQLGVHPKEENVAIFSGAQNALTVMMLSLFSPGDRIATDFYTYSNFMELAKLLRIVLIPVEGDGEGMRPDALEQQCRLNRLQGIYLMPAYANPTTVTVPLSRRRDLADVIRRNHLILMEDDIAAWLQASEQKTIPSMYDLLDGRSIYICGMSKSLCPGLRIAYAAFGGEYRKQILHGLANINIKTSSFDAEVITELILSGAAYKIAEQKRRMTRKTGKIFTDLFGDILPDSGREGYFRWVPIATREPAAVVEKDLLRRGIRVYHSQRFSAAQEEDRHYLRVALCSAGSPTKLESGLHTLRTWMEETGEIPLEASPKSCS